MIVIYMSKLDVENDNIYYNITIPFTPNLEGISPALYQAQLSQPIVYNPQEYYLAVVRFKISGSDIPIFIAKIQPFPNTNVNNTVYSVAISYNGNFSPQTFIQYVPSDLTLQPSLPLTASHPNADKVPYYFVFNYTDFLFMINTALATAFAAVPGGTPVGSVAPYFIFDPVAERVSLIAQQAFYDLSDPAILLPIKVYVNTQLFGFIEGIPAIFNGGPNGQDLYMNIRNLQNSNWYTPSGPNAPAFPLTLLQMEQEYATLANWNSLQTVQVVSNLLPINREYVPSFNNQSSGVISSQGILADFIPLLSNGTEARATIEFVSNGQWRLIDMFGNSPITKVDISFYWTDEDGDQFIIPIPINSVATIKLLFIKKNIV